MARLIPKINPDEIENSGERMLAKSLISQLGAEVEVYHSFRWLAESQKGTLHEGECDFVVLDPSNGLLFIEVREGLSAMFRKRMDGNDFWKMGEAYIEEISLISVPEICLPYWSGSKRRGLLSD